MSKIEAIPFDPEFSAHLQSIVTSARLERMNQVLAERTRWIGVFLEDIYQAHNASAVLRTCDALGIQNVYTLEERNSLRINPEIALGSAQWLSLHRSKKEASGPSDIYEHIKSEGYRLVATSPHADSCTIDTLDLEKGKLVLMFGTEKNGLSDEALAAADEHVRIPMFGFVESFNISVSAAICLANLSLRLRTSNLDWRLTQDEQDQLLYSWMLKTVKNPEKQYASFLEDQKPKT